MTQLEKWQPKRKVSTARNRKAREGYMNIGHHTGRQNLAHGVIEQMEKGDTPMTTEEQQRLDNAAVQMEKIWGLGRGNKERGAAGRERALNPLGGAAKRNKRADEQAKRWRETDSTYASPQVRQERTAAKAAVESPARRKAAQRENIKRAPGRASRSVAESTADKGTGAAFRAAGGVDRAAGAVSRIARIAGKRGKEAAKTAKKEVGAATRATGRGLRTAGEAVEPAGLQRRRAGGPEARAQRRRAGGGGSVADQMGRPTQGNTNSQSNAGSRLSRAFGATKRAAKTVGSTAKEMGREFNAGMQDMSPRNYKAPTGNKPKAAPTTPKKEGGNPTKPVWGQNMEKAVVSLQKFLDNDCGCEGDSLMQNARTKEQQTSGEARETQRTDRARDIYMSGGGIRGSEEYGPHAEAEARGGSLTRARRSARAARQESDTYMGTPKARLERND